MEGRHVPTMSVPRLNLENYKLQLALDNQTLQQNIYTARANAEAAIQKYSAEQESR